MIRLGALATTIPMFLGSPSAAWSGSNAEGPGSLADWWGLEYEPTPHEVVHAENKLQLRYYGNTPGPGQGVPVVLVPAFVNTPAILDLDAERSVVRRFLERGFDVYVVDWGDPSRLDTTLSLDDYVGRYLRSSVSLAADMADSDRVHLFGFSTGAPLAAAFAAMWPDDVATLGLQGPPLDCSADGGLLEYRRYAEAVDLQRFVDAFGNVPPAIYDLLLGLGRPTTVSTDVPVRAVGPLDDTESVARACRVARWMAGGIDVPGELFRQFVEDLLIGNRLMENELAVDDRRVDLGDVTAPVALVLGTEDSYVPRAASLPFLGAVSSEDTRVFEVPADHVGTLVGPDAHETYWPRICDWVEART